MGAAFEGSYITMRAPKTWSTSTGGIQPRHFAEERRVKPAHPRGADHGRKTRPLYKRMQLECASSTVSHSAHVDVSPAAHTAFRSRRIVRSDSSESRVARATRKPPLQQARGARRKDT